MRPTKKWYASKGVQLGALTILIGTAEAVRQLVEQGDFSVLAILTVVVGIMKVVQRVTSHGEEIVL